MKKVLAISGSTREKSINQSFIKAIANLTRSQFIITTYKDISAIPHFNPDLDIENLPAGIIEFRKQIRESDGI